MSLTTKANSLTYNLLELGDTLQLRNLKSASVTFNKNPAANQTIFDLTFDTNDSGVYSLAIYPKGCTRKLALGRRTNEGFELQWEITN